MPDEQEKKKPEADPHISAAMSKLVDVLDLLRKEGIVKGDYMLSEDVTILAAFLSMMTIRLDMIYDSITSEPPDEWKKDSV